MATATAVSGVVAAEDVLRLYEASESIVGQEQARKRLAVLLSHQLSLARGLPGRTYGGLVAGGTGVGKTAMTRLMCEEAGLPFSEANATQITEAGYAGQDLNRVILPLLEKAARVYDQKLRRAPYRSVSQHEGDSVLKRDVAEMKAILEVASTGVILLDEFDKWMSAMNAPDTNGRNKGTALQAELLKMVEGGSPVYVTASDTEEDSGVGIWFDTSRVLFICCGAFVGLRDKVARRLGNEHLTPEDQGFWDLVEPQDFVKYGVMPELSGRLSSHIMLRSLSGRDLARIIAAPGGQVDEFKRRVAEVGGELQLTQGDLTKLGDHASQLGTGARAIEFVLWQTFSAAIFEVAQRGYGTVRLGDGNRAVVI